MTFLPLMRVFYLKVQCPSYVQKSVCAADRLKMLLFRVPLTGVKPNWMTYPVTLHTDPSLVRESQAKLFLESFAQTFRFQADAIEKRLQQSLQVVRTIFETTQRSVRAIHGVTRKD